MEIFQKISGLTPSQMVFVYSYLFKTAYNRIPPNRLKTGFMESYDLRKVVFCQRSFELTTLHSFQKTDYYSNYSPNYFFQRQYISWMRYIISDEGNATMHRQFLGKL